MSEKATPTPGPWEVQPVDFKNLGLNPMVYAGRDEVASVLKYGLNGDPLPYEANARLVAAAPDLLEALQNIATWTDLNNENGWAKHDLNGCIDAVLDTALAAITKATGDPP